MKMWDRTTAAIIKAIRNPLQVLALVVIVIGTSIGIAVKNMGSGNLTWIVVIVGGVVLVIVLVMVFALEHLKTTALLISNTTTRVQVISSRADFYRSAVHLIGSSDEIRDTTWGRPAPEPNDEEKKAREQYRNAIESAAKAGRIYRELFSTTPDERDALIKQLKEKKKKLSKYDARVLKTDLSTFSVQDFIIGDNSKVLFSHVDAKQEVPTYLYVESKEMALLFSRVFQECWSLAEPL